MRYRAVLLIFLVVFSGPARAAPPVCDAGAEGSIIYNKDHKIVQFCNGSQWIGMVARIGDEGDTLGDLSCSNGQIAKFNGTIWTCAADNAGSGGMTALTGDVTGAGSGSVAATIANDAVTSAKIANAAVTVAKLGASGTPSSSVFLRGDGTWAAPPSGADNLGNHIATQAIVSDTTNTDDLGTTAIRWKDGWFQGTVTAGMFAGSGASLTALNAANLASGIVPTARLGTGTADGTTYLRGDGAWASVSGGGVPAGTLCGSRVVCCGAGCSSPPQYDVASSTNIQCQGVSLTVTCSGTKPNVPSNCPSGYAGARHMSSYDSSVDWNLWQVMCRKT